MNNRRPLFRRAYRGGNEKIILIFAEEYVLPALNQVKIEGDHAGSPLQMLRIYII